MTPEPFAWIAPHDPETSKVVTEEVDLFPSHTFHRRFAAVGRAAPAPAEKITEKTYVIRIYTDVATTSAMRISKAQGWWEAANTTLDRPTLQVNFDPAAGAIAGIWAEAVDTARKPAKPEVQEGRIEDFLEEVYSLVKLNEIENATDRIFDHIDRLLCDGEFVVCDEILKRVDVENLPTALMRSFLTITNAAKNRLPSRKSLYEKIERSMSQLKGENRTRRIIGRLA